MAIENGTQNAELGYILDPAFQIEGLNGKPVVGGWICIYEAGTDNKYISYENFDGAQNPFKIPLKADGRAVILGDPSRTYDVYAYDSYGNQLFSRLNVQCNVPGNISINGADTRINNTDGTLDISLRTLGNNVRQYTVNTKNKVLDVQDPLYFVENSNTATIIGFSGSQSGADVNALVHANSATWNDVSAKLNTTAFSTVSGSFLTAHQSLESYATKEYVESATSGKQDKLSAGDGISIVDNSISVTAQGGGRTYSGVEPIWVDNDANLVSLAYDKSQFKVVTGADIAHPELSVLQIDIHTSGGNIDQEAFEKMANLVYGRLTETIPIGLVNSYELLGDGGAFSYLFRPTMEFVVNSATKARIMTFNGSVGNSKAQVAISELNESSASLTTMWWSEIKTLTAAAGTLALSANSGCTENRTLYPDRLYYASVINRDQQTQYVGFKNEFLADAGAYDIAYWDEHSTNNDHFAGNLPGSLSGIAASNLGQTGGAKLKPYIAFRNED